MLFKFKTVDSPLWKRCTLLYLYMHVIDWFDIKDVLLEIFRYE